MSCYYSFYLGYKKDGVIHQLGPFDANGEWHPVLVKSRSFISDLPDSFRRLPEESMDEKLREYFKDYGRDQAGKLILWHLPLDELPTGKISRTRYCLTETVMEAMGDDLSWETEDSLEYCSLSPAEYAVKAEAELKNGYKASTDRDEEEHSCKEYTLFTWVPRDTPEFESWQIRLAAQAYEYSDILEGTEGIVVILTIG